MNYKRILAAALCLCMTAPMAMTVPADNTSALSLVDSEVQHFTDSFVYKIRGDYIEITAVMNSVEGDVKVPAQIDGVPVKVIGEHGIAGNAKITSITLPSTITTIGKQAFSYNTALKSINIPYGVTSIGDEAFMNCMSLNNVTLPGSLTSIGVRAFYSCRKFTEITIPDSVTYLGEMAFADCQELTKINIPSRISKLPEALFGNCRLLEELTIPESVTFISKDALPTRIKNLTILGSKCELEDGLYMHITKECVITAPQGSPAQEFAETYGLEYKELFISGVPVMGDVNNDGLFSTADIVMMQKYLLGAGELTAWESGDMDRDGVLDVYDFIIMRQEIKNSPEFNPPYFPENPDPNLDYTVKNLTVNIQSKEVEGTEADEEFILGQTDFALSLFKEELRDDENTLVSPYSVMQALAMTANGADGTTKTEMEDVLGMPVNSLNKYLYTQRTSQKNDENSKLSTANSIWGRNGINVNKNFLQSTADYYGADFFTAPFDDTTVTDINNWVNDKTDEMIPQILEVIPPNAVMYLINAVAFDAKWETEFNKDMTVKADFTAIDNTTEKVDMMYSDNGAYYLKDENAQGIYKYYKDRKYAFAAMMPDENISVTDYISGLTSESLNGLLENPTKQRVGVKMPKFSYDFDTLLNNTLIEMGMPSAFESTTADFSNMVSGLDGHTYISNVIHKTHIDVDEAGTKAAAATVVEMENDCVPVPLEIVEFNRPFVYFIIDTETNIPVFMGTLMSIPE